jgi:tRNA-2-methylthio-N6-dimethylallyladenosine synthase
MQHLYIKTHGCQMNEYDSKKICDLLESSHALTTVKEAEDADVILINTCSIREKPQENLFSELGRWAKIKAKNPNVIIGVGGCVASQEGGSIVKRAPYVDLVFGPQTLHRLPELINRVLADRKPIVDIEFPEIEKFDFLPTPKAEGPCAYVSIMEGCSKYCSFCVVPYTRGEEISRPFADVMQEIKSLTQQGVREIHLLGQNVNDYQGELDNGQLADLAYLIYAIADIEEVLRIRFTTSHPSAFSDRLIDAFAHVPKLVNHLHLPIQSGSDRILAAMKRGYTALEYKSRIRALREVRPDIALSTDIIVGFPGETDEEFLQTLNLVKALNYDISYSFIYSKRPGTPAASLDDPIDMAVKKRRLAMLQGQLLEQSTAHANAMLGQSVPVLVTGYSKKDATVLSGRTENNRIVNFNGPSELIGQLVDVVITEVKRNSLGGALANT